MIVKCDFIDLNAKKFAFMDLCGELAQITGCNLGEKEKWPRVGFEANYEDIRGVIKVEFGKCDAAGIRDKRAELVKARHSWG